MSPFRAILTLVMALLLLAGVVLLIISFWSDKPIFWKLGFTLFTISYITISVMDKIHVGP